MSEERVKENNSTQVEYQHFYQFLKEFEEKVSDSFNRIDQKSDIIQQQIHELKTKVSKLNQYFDSLVSFRELEGDFIASSRR
eukprot:gene3771-6659_t